MRYSNAEDRLNPVTPAGVDDTTLGGYLAVHGRAPALEGSDGQPYTAAIDVDETGDEAEPWSSYLVFLRWAATGSAIMGHLESDDVVRGASEADVRAAAGTLPLSRVQVVLNETIVRRQREEADAGDDSSGP